MLKIRRYEPQDYVAVWNLHNLALNQVGAHAGNGPWDADLHSIEAVYLENDGEFLVGELNGRVVAMGALKKTSSLEAEIKRMRVHPRYQQRGFGTLILQALEARAVEMGYKVLRLDTTTKQNAAQKLYRRHGYQVVGRGKVAGFDVLFFEKELR